jgi:heme exporter protein B
MTRTNSYARAVWVQLGKELRLEWRSKDAVNAMLFLALLVVVLFSLAFDLNRAEAREIAGGIVCVAVLFAATGSLNQAWVRELRGGVMDAQRMSPAPWSALLLGKVVANFLFVTVVELVLAPLFVVFYNLEVLGSSAWLLLLLPLGTWALVGNGIFFATLSLRARSRELLLPLLLFPIFIPALLAMTSGIGAVFTGEGDPVLWVKMLAGYDVVFTTAAVLLFGLVLNAEA